MNLHEDKKRLLDRVVLLEETLTRLRDAAEVYAADQSKATDARVGLVQPVTVEEAQELCEAIEQADKVLQ